MKKYFILLGLIIVLFSCKEENTLREITVQDNEGKEIVAYSYEQFKIGDSVLIYKTSYDNSWSVQKPLTKNVVEWTEGSDNTFLWQRIAIVKYVY